MWRWGTRDPAGGGSRVSRRAIATEVPHSRVTAVVVAVWVLAWPVVVALLTVHATIQQPAYYRRALDEADVYDRLYTQVLTDPQIIDVTEQLMARLPVDRTVVTDNLRVVIPPSALRGVAERLADQVAAYCAGRTDQLDLRVDLQPVFANIARLVSLYLLGHLSDARTYHARDVAALVHTLLTVAAEISHGRPPASVPTLTLTTGQAQTVADAVLATLTPAQRSSLLRDQLVVLLGQGDLPGALALVGPLLFHGAGEAIADLQARLGGNQLDLGRPFTHAADSPLTRGLHSLHALGAVRVLSIAATLAAVMLAALAIGVRRARSRGARAWPVILAALISAGIAGLLATAGLEVTLSRSLASPPTALASLPPGARRLVDDVTAGLTHELITSWLRLAAAPLALTVALLAGRLLTGPVTGGIARLWTVRGPWVTTGLVGVTAAALSATTWLVAPAATNAGTVVCNDSAQLCSRRYDQVTYPATHNAMAASDAEFLAPDQDLDLIGQLDRGVRALLIDVHRWTTVQQVGAFLAGLPADQRRLLEPYLRAPVGTRPGLWLCHNVCQLGALDLAGQLQRLRAWLDANPTEIITLIIQDEAPAAEIMAAFAQAGLGRYLLTPPDDPAGDWPRLGDMIRTGRRLVVLAEQADEPGTWYRRLFRYASDTPFHVTSPDAFTCDPDRGDPHAPLLLINHWVSRAAGSRYDATIANSRTSLLAHIRLCETTRSRRPTFLAVDFAGIGDLIATTAELNTTQGPH
jgi:uncharacterized membrane protein YhaH (DUF805 family)